MKCSECGAELTGEDKFCNECGAAIPGAAIPAESDQEDLNLTIDDIAEKAAEDLVVESESLLDETEAVLGETEETLQDVASDAIEDAAPLMDTEVFNASEQVAPPPPPPPPVVKAKGKPSTGLIIGIVVLVLLLLCCCCAIGIGVANFDQISAAIETMIESAP